MAAVWSIVEFIMLFGYFDLPTAKPISDDEKSEHSIDCDHSVNSTAAPVGSISAARVERSYDSTILNDSITDDLTSNGAVIEGEKQKLVNINAEGLHRRQRKASVSDKWHLARGRHETSHCTLKRFIVI